MTEFKLFPICQVLRGAAILTLKRDPLTLPHFAREWKGPRKDITRADGACIVYSKEQAYLFLGTPDPAGYAYV
jgi:hypothetical protein